MMKPQIMILALLFVAACNQEELERLTVQNQQKQKSLDSLKGEYQKLNEFKSNVIRDFGESASKLQERLDENRRLEEALASEKNTVIDRDKRIDTLMNTIKLRDGEIANQKKDVARQEALIDKLQERIKQQDGVAQSLNETISQRDATIRNLTGTVSQRDASITKLNSRISEQDQTIKDLQKKPEPKEN